MHTGNAVLQRFDTHRESRDNSPLHQFCDLPGSCSLTYFVPSLLLPYPSQPSSSTQDNSQPMNPKPQIKTIPKHQVQVILISDDSSQEIRQSPKQYIAPPTQKNTPLPKKAAKIQNRTVVESEPQRLFGRKVVTLPVELLVQQWGGRIALLPHQIRSDLRQARQSSRKC